MSESEIVWSETVVAKLGLRDVHRRILGLRFVTRNQRKVPD